MVTASYEVTLYSYVYNFIYSRKGICVVAILSPYRRVRIWVYNHTWVAVFV